MLHMDSSGSWSLGVLIGGPGVVVLILIGLFAIGIGIWLKSGGDRDTWVLFVGGSAWIVCVLAFALSPLGFYPLNAEYHQWRDVSGAVAKIDSRLISSGSDSTQTKFVVRFDGSSLQFGCDDTRCASVTEGDSLTLSCKRAWQYTGTDGYDCRFVSTEAATR